MRVIMANPPGYGGPDYDDHLCRELGALGVEVELVTSRFRFGDVPDPVGYRRKELFYPYSSRLFRRSRLRVPLRSPSTRSGWRGCGRSGGTSCTSSG